jgi:hypothetical protein
VLCRIDVLGNLDREYMQYVLWIVSGLNMLFFGAGKMLFFGPKMG